MNSFLRISICIVITIFFACKDEPLVVEGIGLELKFMRNNENVSHEFRLDSILVVANCSLTPSGVWAIEHRDTSLLFDIRSCCGLDSAIYKIRLKTTSDELDSFLFYKDTQNVPCSITDARALSPNSILEYTDEKITLIINE